MYIDCTGTLTDAHAIKIYRDYEKSYKYLITGISFYDCCHFLFDHTNIISWFWLHALRLDIKRNLTLAAWLLFTSCLSFSALLDLSCSDWKFDLWPIFWYVSSFLCVFLPLPCVFMQIHRAICFQIAIINNPVNTAMRTNYTGDSFW